MKEAYIAPRRLQLKNRILLEQLDGIISEYIAKRMTLSVRQAYYQCVTRQYIQNKPSEYQRICNVIKEGRLGGQLDWDGIEDRTRNIRQNSHWDSPEEIIEVAAQSYHIDLRATQPFYIEAWCEKDSLISILEPVCYELDVPCFSCRGFSSVSELREAAIRFTQQDKPGIILYAGDHDPSGLHIPVKIQEYLNLFGAEVELRRIGLTLAQVKKFNLPPNTAKEKDKNYKSYVATTGLKQSWELDALQPEELADLFARNINDLTDFREFDRMKAKQADDLAYFKKITIPA